jgi:hypothetical protein
MALSLKRFVFLVAAQPQTAQGRGFIVLGQTIGNNHPKIAGWRPQKTRSPP